MGPTSSSYSECPGSEPEKEPCPPMSPVGLELVSLWAGPILNYLYRDGGADAVLGAAGFSEVPMAVVV